MTKIRELKDEDIPTIIKIHCEAIGYSLNARLGRNHLLRIYTCVQNSDAAIVHVIEVDGIISGVASATIDPDKLSSEIIKSLSVSQKLLLAVNLTIRPWLILNVWEHHHLAQPFVYKNVLIRPCLTMLAVAPQYRCHGLGKALIVSVENYFKSRKVNYYRVDIFKTNTKARVFYRNLEFVEVGQIGRNIILIKSLNNTS